MRLLIGLLLGLSIARAAPLTDPVADADRVLLLHWDPWSLQDRRLANRRLAEQLDTPAQRHRLFSGDERLVIAADAQTGTSYPTPNFWHGHVVGDVFAAWRAVDGVELNLNLPVYNVTASSGARRATGVLPGVAVHLSRTWDRVALDFLATDLGQVTLGSGLLFEQMPLDGALVQARWDEVWLRGLIGGQVHLFQDDLFVVSSGWGPFEFNWLAWNQTHLTHFLSLAVETPGLGQHLRLTAEAAARLPDGQPARGAGMLRADWIPPRWRGLQIHLGYQARYYQQGISKQGSRVRTVTHGPAMIWREDTWFTNAFQAWWPSPFYDQLWQTGMLEAHWRFGPHWAFRGELEAALKTFDDAVEPARRLPRLGFDDDPLLPWPERRLLFRVGAELTPFADLPHRLRLWVLNKETTLVGLPSTATPTRFTRRDPTVAFEVEIFL